MSDSSNSCLIITGMHRSNTSFLAKSFMKAGLHIGDDLVPADQFNQEGHFEDQEFVTFHQSLIKKYKLTSWYSIIDYKKCRTLKFLAADKEQAQSIIQSRWVNRGLFGWKDPRTCHFLPFWKELIPQAKFIFIVRDPEASVSSLLRRYRQNNGASYRPDLWHRYHRFWQVANQQIIDACQHYQDDVHLIITPEDINNPERSAALNNTLSNQWGLSLRPVHLSDGYRKDLITSPTSKDATRSNKKSIELYEQLKVLRNTLV